MEPDFDGSSSTICEVVCAAEGRPGSEAFSVNRFEALCACAAARFWGRNSRMRGCVSRMICEVLPAAHHTSFCCRIEREGGPSQGIFDSSGSRQRRGTASPRGSPCSNSCPSRATIGRLREVLRTSCEAIRESSGSCLGNTEGTIFKRGRVGGWEASVVGVPSRSSRSAGARASHIPRDGRIGSFAKASRADEERVEAQSLGSFRRFGGVAGIATRGRRVQTVPGRVSFQRHEVLLFDVGS